MRDTHDTHNYLASTKSEPSWVDSQKISASGLHLLPGIHAFSLPWIPICACPRYQSVPMPIVLRKTSCCIWSTPLEGNLNLFHTAFKRAYSKTNCKYAWLISRGLRSIFQSVNWALSSINPANSSAAFSAYLCRFAFLGYGSRHSGQMDTWNVIGQI